MTKVTAILIGVLASTLAHADGPSPGAPCEAPGAVSQVGMGVGVNVFTCLKGTWEHTSTVGPQRYRITVKMLDGSVYTFVTLSGQPVMTSLKKEHAITSFLLTATAADGGNASASNKVAVNEWSTIKLGELDMKVSVAEI